MNMQTVIYLIRHGECDGNAENRLRGRVDFALNQTGYLQAKALAKALEDKHFDYIYSSPLKRASKTAAIIAEHHGVTVTLCDRFNNMRLGVWENRKKEEIEAEYPELWKLWLTNPEILNIEGAETVDDVQMRAFSALNEIVNAHPGAKIAIVSHRGVLKPLFAAALGIRKPYMWRVVLDNASYSCFIHTAERGYTLVQSNNIEHLKDIPFVREFN